MSIGTYSKEKMKLRDEVLHHLLLKFGSYKNEDGSPVFSNQSLYECAQDWTTSGKLNLDGVDNFYMKNYT